MVDIAEKNWRQGKNSAFLVAGYFSYPLPEIPTSHNIKETASKGNIWGPFYTSKGEVSGDG